LVTVPLSLASTTETHENSIVIEIILPNLSIVNLNFTLLSEFIFFIFHNGL